MLNSISTHFSIRIPTRFNVDGARTDRRGVSVGIHDHFLANFPSRLKILCSGIGLEEMHWVFAIKFGAISLKISLTGLFYGFEGGDRLVFPLILVVDVLVEAVQV